LFVISLRSENVAMRMGVEEGVAFLFNVHKFRQLPFLFEVEPQHIAQAGLSL
jgi:hypothetical protein